MKLKILGIFSMLFLLSGCLVVKEVYTPRVVIHKFEPHHKKYRVNHNRYHNDRYYKRVKRQHRKHMKKHY